MHSNSSRSRQVAEKSDKEQDERDAAKADQPSAGNKRPVIGGASASGNLGAIGAHNVSRGAPVQRLRGLEGDGSGDPTIMPTNDSRGNGSMGWTAGDKGNNDFAGADCREFGDINKLQEPSSSPRSTAARISKKRPREESAPHHSSSLGSRPGGNVSPDVPARARSPAGDGLARAGSEVEKQKALQAQDARNDPLSRDGAAPRGEPIAANARLGDGPTVKPLEDPHTAEVVSQDLATGEVRRIRRKLENDHPDGGAAPSGADGIADGGKEGAKVREAKQESKGVGANNAKGQAVESKEVDPAKRQAADEKIVESVGNGGDAAEGIRRQPQANGKMAGGEGGSDDQQKEESNRGEEHGKKSSQAIAGSTEGGSTIDGGSRFKDEGGDDAQGDGGGVARDGTAKVSMIETLDDGKDPSSSDNTTCGNASASEGKIRLGPVSRDTIVFAPLDDGVAANSQGSTNDKSEGFRRSGSGAGASAAGTSSPKDREVKLTPGSSAASVASATMTSSRTLQKGAQPPQVGEEGANLSAAASAGSSGLRTGEQKAGRRDPMDEERAPEVAGVEGDRHGELTGNAEKEALVPAPAVGPSSRECPPHALPVARKFFDFNTVSSFEMRMLPEFFTGRSPSKTPEAYMQSRNYMVRSYQRMLDADQDGQGYLTGTECRRKLAGDACSILRIHEFLDRFGLINTRTGGRRPPSYPVPPPAAHLWAPSAICVGAVVGTRGNPRKDAGAAGRGARGETRIEEQAVNDARMSERADEREWDRQELLRLMEAAVANPDQWDVVAHEVGGGRSSTACMRRFLNLAVEETLAEQDDAEEEHSSTVGATGKSERAAPLQRSGSTEPPTTTESASPTGMSTIDETIPPVSGTIPESRTATSPGKTTFEGGDSHGGTSGVASATSGGEDAAALTKATAGDGDGMTDGQKQASSGSALNTRKHGSGGADRIPPARTVEAQKHDNSRYSSRSSRQGSPAPALMLASALVSSVHPEVLKAAMSAATAAADDVARRSASVWLSSDGRRRGAVVGVTNSKGPQRSQSTETLHNSVAGYGHGTHEPSTVNKRDRDGDEDVDMRDYTASSSAVAGGAGQGAWESEQQRADRLHRVNGQRPRGLEDAESASEKILRSIQKPCDSFDEAATSAGWLGAEDGSGLTIERQAARASAARAAVLSVAGLQARGLAEVEDRRTEKLVADLLEARVQRLETKLHCLEELDKVLDAERRSLEHDRAEVLAEQARFMLSK